MTGRDLTTEKPWSCHDCDTPQQSVTHNGRPFYSSSGWYWVKLRPGVKPVYLCASCFSSYDQDWPEYDGTYENSPWRRGEWEGEWLWVLPADYFTRRDAYRKLPRWKTCANGCKLVTHDGRILGRVESYVKFRQTLYRAYDDRGRLMSGRLPMSMLFAKGMVEVHHGLADEGMVQR